MAPVLERSPDSFDPYKANAYSGAVKFDLELPPECYISPKDEGEDRHVGHDVVKYNPEISMKVTPPKHWELDVKGLLCCSKEQLHQIESRLTQAITLYKRRLEWLTTESRRIFGVVQEKCIAIVLDICNMSPQQLDQYRTALDRVLQEQVSRVAKFNLIRLADASSWMWKLDRCAAVSRTATCEAVMKAVTDKQVEAVYLFTEGSAADGARELLKEKLIGSRVPVHVVSYNCTEPSTIDFLKDLSRMTGGRFHAYAVIMEMDSYERDTPSPRTNQANIILRKKTYGGVPPGAGMREDVMLLFEELEEARNNLAQIQDLIEDYPTQHAKPCPERLQEMEDKSLSTETYMSSREWLDKFGLKAKKLGFYDVLAGVAFRHQDGVTMQKLVNAKYCDQFPHVRIDWLQQGSRELFGTVIEERMYFLLDTSSSMAPHIQFVKDKMFVLMQEQLRHKQKFNLIAFNSRVESWKDRLVEPPKSILAQLQVHPKIPVHTISFNCADRDANDFLCQLARDTRGRFHYYSENGIDPEGPEPWEAAHQTPVAGSLHEQCPRVQVLPLSPSHFPTPFNCSQLPQSTVDLSTRHTDDYQVTQYDLKFLLTFLALTAKERPPPKCYAAPTKTSILRTLGCRSSQDVPEWMLPETRRLFDRQSLCGDRAEETPKRGRRGRKLRKSSDSSNGKTLMSSAKWLSIHGLAARKLTILDALAPTFIPHRGKYVGILGKKVNSKVFDDILPIAHVSSSQCTLVNPPGAHLEDYRKKVKAAIKGFNRRLDRIVWAALPDSEKEQLDSDSALPFIENKTRLLQALERSDWPISQKDIVLLENEIKQGESYIQQAKELEEGAVTKGPLPEEEEGDGDKDNSDAEQSDDPQTKVGGSDSESYSDSFE
ncbi:hypothetical protein NP493_671g01028 [Ridgeia piscesae]|uniref:VWFA domain-containing protein n=1 Tax=Ridgeia piscesae TaxID=27915 RepID=A0AAD9NR15_RIDPI|nr:hypothetical protein NP493_671g01028 [Ridgeia piscesae]